MLSLIIIIQMFLKNNSSKLGWVYNQTYTDILYRQPKTLLQNYVDFINEFTHILTDLEKQNIDVIIAGDYNIDLLKRKKYF